MLRRPKPTDSEADLLREQELFLNSGASSKVNVVRRPDKRRGEAFSILSRRVLFAADLPDQLPTLTPAPPKKSRFKANSVRFEEEDPEERLDRQDTHISAVLSRIIVSVCGKLNINSAVPFFHQVPLPAGKRSIFARQIAAQRLKEGKTLLHCAPKAETKGQSLPAETTSGPWLVSGQGLGGPDSPAETMRIHRENEAKLQAMSESEIREEQKKLLSQLDPRLVEFVRSRKAQSVPPSTTPSKYPEDKRDQEECLPKNVDNESDSSSAAGLHQKPLEKELPVKPQKEWVHMDKLEPEKLEWTRDLPAPRRKGTKKAMQARFDFAGTLIPPTEDLPTHLGLHHHGEEPELAGYSLQELFLLSRSQVIQQRSLALSTIASVLAKARAGEYTSVLRGNMTSTLLDAGLLFLLRFALDDSVEGVMSAAVHALRALLVSPEDEECMDSTFSWFRGLASFPLLPSSQEEEDEDNEGLEENMKETVKEKEERKTDYDVARLDVVKGLLKMKLLPRLRYILEVVRPAPRVVQDILEVLTRIARHSSSSATQVLDCPRLMETVMSEFLPTSWTMQSLPLPQSVYGLPLASAMKLLRVIATSGRHACARLLNSLGARERLSRLLSVEPSELLLEPAEALRITTEAYRLWAVAAGYGQYSPSCSEQTNRMEIYWHLVVEGKPPVSQFSPFLCVILQFSGLLLSEPVTGYLRSCSQAVPTLSHTSAWLLRHEHHLLFLLLRLAHRLVVAKHTSLYHQVALVLLPWLLPSSEYLAHELLSTIVFSKEFISEGHSGGPEAIELSELKLYEDTHHHTAPSFQTVGALLREACVQLPSIRGCFLTHLAHLEASVLVSRDAYLGRNPWINSQLLPELTGPTLPSDWPFLPLVSLYERMGVSNGGGLQVEELPQGALQAVTHCLQWLLLLEVWREDALKVVLPVAKLARLSCVFLCSSDLFLERPVQKLSWGLLRLLTRPSRLDSLDLDVPPPGLASFQDLYSALLAQYEAVSFGDRLFGCWVLLPLQRRYSSTLRLAVFGEHVGMLRSLGVTLEQLPVPLERFTSPPEDSLPLLRLYFRSLVTGTLKRCWCPVLYVVALSHLNTFIFSQDAAAQVMQPVHYR
uniref:RNA polymerase II associated protein 1 n=1 Tax=Myripristis murdjan TaxID=586833 RepID=A0A667YMW4_9TELE